MRRGAGRLGMVVLCGFFASLAVTPGPAVARVTPTPPDAGSVLWTARYDGPGYRWDVASAVAMSPDGSRVYVTGRSQGQATYFDIATVAYDAATGAQLWAARYDGPKHDTDEGTAVEVSPDGSRVYVTGNARFTDGLDDYVTFAYDAATGAQLWMATYNGPGNSLDVPGGMVISPDGSSIYVTGLSWGDGSLEDYATIAYEAATGQQRWLARYGNDPTGPDFGNALALSPDGGVLYVTGGSWAFGTFDDFTTLAYDAATGDERWVSRVDEGHDFQDATAIAISPDGDTLAVTGSSETQYRGEDWLTVGIDAATGQERWSARNGGPRPAQDYARAVTVAGIPSTVVVTGVAPIPVVAYDATTGAVVWTAHGAGAFTGWAVAPSPDGTRVYATGSSLVSVVVEDATVIYDPVSGQEIDVLRNGPGSAFANVVGPDGTELVVTGQAGTQAFGYGTIAYQVGT